MDHFRKRVKGGTEQAPVFMLYRHILDLGDSIASLLAFGSASTASVILRSLFESNLALNFILEGNTLNKERSLAYWAHYQIKRLDVFKKYDPSTEMGKQFHTLLDSNQVFQKANFQEKDYADERFQLEQILNQDKFHKFIAKYKTLKKEKKPRHWYSLCSDAINLRSLARKLVREPEYALFYSQLSEIAHATDVITELLVYSEEGKTLIHPLRRGPSQKIKNVCTLTSTYLLGSHMLIMESYFKNDGEVRSDFEDWWEKYRVFHNWLSGSST